MMMKMMGGCCFCLFRDENIRRDIEDGLGRGGSRRRSGGGVGGSTVVSMVRGDYPYVPIAFARPCLELNVGTKSHIFLKF